MQWCSILVSFAGCEEGPKNPLFGIPVNPVVSASYAQSGVDAVGRRFCACGGRAVSNGMEKMTRSLWRLDIVQRRTPFAVSDRCTIPDMNLHCGATRLQAVNAVCRVAWREPAGKGKLMRPALMALSTDDIPLKDGLQKRIRVGKSCCGNHLDCRKGFYGIAVRTKWQSGSGHGDRPTRA